MLALCLPHSESAESCSCPETVATGERGSKAVLGAATLRRCAAHFLRFAAREPLQSRLTSTSTCSRSAIGGAVLVASKVLRALALLAAYRSSTRGLRHAGTGCGMPGVNAHVRVLNWFVLLPWMACIFGMFRAQSSGDRPVVRDVCSRDAGAHLCGAPPPAAPMGGQGTRWPPALCLPLALRMCAERVRAARACARALAGARR